MKVLFVNKYLYRKGGAESVLFQEREAMLQYGHTVIDFSMHHPQNVPSDYRGYFVSNVDYHAGKRSMFDAANVAVRFVHNREAVRNLSALIAKEKPQIAHLHNIYHQITPAVIPVLKKAGIKVVLTLHDLKLLCPAYLMLSHGSICRDCAGGHFYPAALRRCQEGSLASSILLAVEAYWQKIWKTYEMVDLFLAPSQFMENMMTQGRIDRKKIVVLNNGIDVAKFKPSPVDKEYILYFGRIAKEKGIKTLLSAYTGLNTTMPLRIVGSGPLKSELQAQYPKVEFLDHMAGDDLQRLIAEASFSVVPSECYENCSMAVLESMAYGKPVIGSNIGGIPEQIENGTSGFLFEKGDVADLGKQMFTLNRNRTLRREMGAEGRKIVERKYSLKEHSEKLAGMYRELVSRPNGTGH